jgi:folate-binding protein YgfZ
MQKKRIPIPASPDDFNTLLDTTTVSVLDDESTNHYGLLEITGADSAKFLQGQLTCNMQDITTEQSRTGAHCTHKGRMVASFRLLQKDENSYLFILPVQTLPSLQKSLAKYIVFSKAKLRDASDDYLLLGISGPNATQLVSDVFSMAPAVRNSQQKHENGIAICVDENNPRYLCLVPAEKADTVCSALAPSIALTPSATITDCRYWHWLDIRDGLGEVRAQTIEEFIPQMLNMQMLDGISFTKGCYTGQEIVARMQYRGTLKKGMYRITGSGDAPAPNAPFFSHDQNDLPEQGQPVGHLVMAENITPDAWEGLAVITHDAIHHALCTENRQPVTLLALPYQNLTSSSTAMNSSSD